MNTKKLDLEIDTIGGLSLITVEEEKALNKFLKRKKQQKRKLKKN